MGVTPMASLLKSTCFSAYAEGRAGYIPSGTSQTAIGPGSAATGTTTASGDSGASLDAADYADMGGTAQGSMSISSYTPPGCINSCALDTVDPIVGVPDAYTYDCLVNDIDRLKKKYPSLLTSAVLGQSADGRNIYELTVGNSSAGTHILIDAAVHAREYITSNLCMKQLEYILQYAGNGSFDGRSMKDWLNSVCIHFVPMVNPDGVSISQFGLDSVRSQAFRDIINAAYAADTAAGRTSLEFPDYLRRWKANARGVNLNNNFDAYFERVTSGSDVPSSGSYKGSHAASEPETVIMTNLLNRTHFKAVVNYHSMGNVIYWDVSDNKLREHSRDLANNISLLTGYKMQISDDGGGLKDYCQLKNNPSTSITIEVGSTQAPVNPGEMPVIWAQNKFVPFYTMKWATLKGK